MMITTWLDGSIIIMMSIRIGQMKIILLKAYGYPYVKVVKTPD